MRCTQTVLTKQFLLRRTETEAPASAQEQHAASTQKELLSMTTALTTEPLFYTNTVPLTSYIKGLLYLLTSNIKLYLNISIAKLFFNVQTK